MISEDEVSKLARLARLSVEPDFIPVVTKHLNSIIEYVKRLEAVDTHGVEPMSHVHGSKNVLRQDEIVPVTESSETTIGNNSPVPKQPTLSTEEALCNAPDRAGRFIRVPIIIE